MMSFMKRHFGPYCCLLLASGLMVFQKLRVTDDHKNKAVSKALYLTYSLACFALFININVLYFYQMIAMFLSDVRVFTMWLYVVVFSVVLVKEVLNVLCVAFKTRNLFHFFDESTRYEVSVNFVPPKCCRQPAGHYALRVLQFLVFVGNVCICSYLVYDFIDYSVRDTSVRVALKVACVTGNFVFYVYQMCDFIILRPCLEVLLLYIRQQHEALRDLMDGGAAGLLFVKRENKVEEIRLSLCAILQLKNQLNGIWRWSVMVSSAVVLLLACISIYTAFVEGFSSLQPLLCLLYCALCVLDLLDIAVLSQEMVNEMSVMFLRDVQVFTLWLYVVVHCAISVKVLLNVLSVALNPREIFHFFKESARYEASVNFIPPKCCKQPAGRYVLRLLQLLAFVGTVFICTYVVYDFIDYSVHSTTVKVLLKIASLAGNLLFFVHQMSDLIVLRPCVEVLLFYIRQQHEVIQCLMDGDDGGSVFVKRDKKVEEVRRSLRVISLLKNQLNNICRWSVMISAAVVLLLVCISIYTAFVEGFSSAQPLLGVFYGVLSALEILDIAWLSQDMVNEISYLRDTIKPNEMAITGS
ncbi:hypothetical protein MTO96_012404 [Rhipicephalus appendiculatus]